MTTSITTDIGNKPSIAIADRANASFPELIHHMLTEIDHLDASGQGQVNSTDLKTVVSWQDHGMAFKIHDKKKFQDIVMPIWFPKLKLSSFVRQLSLYGFKRIHTKGADKKAWCNKNFVRGAPELSANMQKIKRRGSMAATAMAVTAHGNTGASCPSDEQARVMISPHSSSGSLRDLKTTSNVPLKNEDFFASSYFSELSSLPHDDEMPSISWAAPDEELSFAVNPFLDELLTSDLLEPTTILEDKEHAFDCDWEPLLL